MHREENDPRPIGEIIAAIMDKVPGDGLASPGEERPVGSVRDHAAALWVGGINSAGSSGIPCARDADKTCCIAVAGIRPVLRQYWMTEGGRPILAAASRTVPNRERIAAIWLMGN